MNPTLNDEQGLSRDSNLPVAALAFVNSKDTVWVNLALNDCVQTRIRHITKRSKVPESENDRQIEMPKPVAFIYQGFNRVGINPLTEGNTPK